MTVLLLTASRNQAGQLNLRVNWTASITTGFLRKKGIGGLVVRVSGVYGSRLSKTKRKTPSRDYYWGLYEMVDALGIEPSGPMTNALQALSAPYGTTHPWELTYLSSMRHRAPITQTYRGTSYAIAMKKPKIASIPVLVNWMRRKYSKLLGRAYETDRYPESPQWERSI